MSNSASQEVTLNVTGMKCGGCESNVKGKLTGLDGVLSIDASSKENSVSVKFDEASTSLDEIKQVITEAGFTVEDT